MDKADQSTIKEPKVIDVTTAEVYEIGKYRFNVVGSPGLGNKIVLRDVNRGHVSMKVSFNGGKQNIIEVGSVHLLSGEANFVGDKNSFLIEDSIQQINIRATFYKNNNSITIGKNVSANLVDLLVDGGSKVIEIGEECMFSWGIYLRTSDSHAVIDMAQKKVVNFPKNIRIEPYVWLAQDVLIMKGVTIGRGSIVGARSVVTRDIPPFSLAVGTPAKVIKEEVTWSRHSLPNQKIIEEEINIRMRPC